MSTKKPAGKKATSARSSSRATTRTTRTTTTRSGRSTTRTTRTTTTYGSRRRRTPTVAASVGSAIGLLIAGFLLKLHLVEWVVLIGAAALIGVVVFLWRRQAAARPGRSRALNRRNLPMGRFLRKTPVWR